MNASHADPADAPKLAVVIPYYQREPGILRRALASIFNQAGIPATSILTVDDASPFSAESEVQSLAPEQRRLVRIINQPNAGPGMARNRGLDALSEETEFVAFLDSDDEWLPDHLQRAVAALRQGHDFYFASHYDIDETIDSFARRDLLKNERTHPLASLEHAYSHRGDLKLQILECCPIETSTVVFRWSALRDLRFRREFRDAYEDLAFWFEAAQRTGNVAFSTKPEARYGRGINIYRGVAGGSDASLRRIVAGTRFRAYARRHWQLSPVQARAVRNRLALSRRHFIAEVIHRLRHGPPLPWKAVSLQLRADPRTAMCFVPEVAHRLFARAYRVQDDRSEAR